MNKSDLNSKKKNAMNKANKASHLKSIQSQQDDYVAEMKKTHKKYVPLIATKNFMISIRDSGYKSTGTAINELIDNSIEAKASEVMIFNTYDNGDIGDIFVIDNGSGMSGDMMKHAVAWAGTHRHLSDDFWGKYGFGLPSAGMFLTEEYELFSKRKDSSNWSSINISLANIQAENYDSSDGIVTVPEPKSTKLPKAVIDYLSKQGVELSNGTVVQLKSPKKYLTGITWGYNTTSSLEGSLLRSIGVTYRKHQLLNTTIRVNNNIVEPIDPLFLDPDSKYYDQRGSKEKETEKELDGISINELKKTEKGREKLFEQGIIAKAFDSCSLKLKSSKGEWGTLRFRFSLMHPNFAKAWQGDKLSRQASGKNPRYKLMKENNSYMIITRAGRQIDIVDSKYDQAGLEPDLGIDTKNYSRYWAVELDFDPVLDSYFGITVNKQQVTLSNVIWEALAKSGKTGQANGSVNIPAFIKQLDKYVNDCFKSEKAARDLEAQKREGSKAQEAAAKFGNLNSARVNEHSKEEAIESLKQEATQKAAKEKKSFEEAEAELIEEYTNQKYVVEYENSPMGPICRCELKSPEQVRVIYNKAHPFIKKFYLSSEFNEVVRDAVDAYFFAWSESFLMANDARQLAMQQNNIDISQRTLETLTYIADGYNLEGQEEYDKSEKEN